MKKTIYAFSLLVIMSGCGYQTIGDLTMISNRNIDSSVDYKILQRNVEGKASMKKDDALERAVDNATETYQGEFLMNVKISVKNNGKKIKVVGDVWGTKTDTL